ncbi:MAG: hypothetical protein JW717_01135 [Marinilabiliaceae bacterium]|nr:hypothetical protein [Marinilabiliaceae bacterium]
MKYRWTCLLLIKLLCIDSNSYGQDIAGLKNEKFFNISGQLGASMVSYHVDGRETTRPDFSWMIVGNPVISLYGITFPFSMTISDQHRSFSQPFNKIGVSPYYKWAKLHLGYRNPFFSQYTLGGHTILGAGGEFTPGKFKIGIMHGRLYKQVNSDPLLLSNPDKYQVPYYKRNGTGLMLGYGSGTNSVNISFFHGLDVVSSVNSQTQTLIKPAENAVISISTKQKIAKKYEFGLEFAKSAYTSDTQNDSLKNGSSFFSSLIKYNATTTESNVIDIHFGYNTEMVGLNLRLKQIDPGFRSMGTYYIQNDYRNITIEPRYSFCNKKYSLNGSLGFQKDNIKKTTPYQTNRTIGSLSFSAMPWNWYKADITISNYNTLMKRGLSEIDTLMKVSQTTRSFNMNQNFNFTKEIFAHNFFVVFNNQKLKDNNQNSASYNNYSSNMFSGSYFLSYIPKAMNVSVTYNLSSFDLASINTHVRGPVIAYSAAFFKNKLNFSVSNSFYKTIVNSVDDNQLGIISINSSYRIAKQHRFRLSYYNHKSKSLNGSSTNFTENKGEIGYSYTF